RQDREDGLLEYAGPAAVRLAAKFRARTCVPRSADAIERARVGDDDGGADHAGERGAAIRIATQGGADATSVATECCRGRSARSGEGAHALRGGHRPGKRAALIHLRASTSAATPLRWTSCAVVEKRSVARTPKGASDEDDISPTRRTGPRISGGHPGRSTSRCGRWFYKWPSRLRGSRATGFRHECGRDGYWQLTPFPKWSRRGGFGQPLGCGWSQL